MSELGPTRTEHEPTATERLRALLDERGADYRVSATGYSIDIGPYTTAYANRSDTTLDVSLRQVTPEQAIAATLGDSDATGERRCDVVEVVRCRDCAHAVVSRPFYTFAGRPADIEVWRCDYFWNVDEPPEVEPDGFCAWGRRANEQRGTRAQRQQSA